MSFTLYPYFFFRPAADAVTHVSLRPEPSGHVHQHQRRSLHHVARGHAVHPGLRGTGGGSGQDLQAGHALQARPVKTGHPHHLRDRQKPPRDSRKHIRALVDRGRTRSAEVHHHRRPQRGREATGSSECWGLKRYRLRLS